jgi:hypothetical protein
MVIKIVREDGSSKLVGCDDYDVEQYALKLYVTNADNKRVIMIYPLCTIREIIIE